MGSRPSQTTGPLVAPGPVDVRLLTMTPRLDGLREPLPPNRVRRAVELVAYLALHSPDVVTERSAADPGARLDRRRRRVQDAVQRRPCGPQGARHRRRGESALSGGDARRDLPGVARR